MGAREGGAIKCFLCGGLSKNGLHRKARGSQDPADIFLKTRIRYVFMLPFNCHDKVFYLRLRLFLINFHEK